MLRADRGQSCSVLDAKMENFLEALVKEKKVKFSQCSSFLPQLGDDSSEGADAHPWLLVPDIPHAPDLLPNQQAEG